MRGFRELNARHFEALSTKRMAIVEFSFSVQIYEKVKNLKKVQKYSHSVSSNKMRSH